MTNVRHVRLHSQVAQRNHLRQIAVAYPVEGPGPLPLEKKEKIEKKKKRKRKKLIMFIQQMQYNAPNRMYVFQISSSSDTPHHILVL